MDSIRYKFGGYSTPEDRDAIGIYILTGFQNLSIATSKTLLFDFRNDEYIPDYTNKIKTDITLPPLEGISYFAIRYRNSDCSAIQNELATVCQTSLLMNDNSISIDLSGKSKGLYIIKIRENGKMISRKIVVQ